MIVSPAEWQTACKEYLIAAGIPEPDASVTAESVVLADLRGIRSHGASRLPIYKKRIEAGVVNKTPHPAILRDHGAMFQLDCDNGLGQPTAHYALREALFRAKEAGLAAAWIRHSNHLGMLAYYALKACEQHMIAFITCHTMSVAPAPGGLTPVVGTNPHCWGFPAAHGPIISDLAITPSRGKIKDLAAAGKELPAGWATDTAGAQTLDPSVALSGLLQCIGGAKGYGFGVTSILLSGVLNEAPFRSSDLPHCLENMEEEAQSAAFLLLIDPEVLSDYDRYIGRTALLYDYVKASDRREGVNEVYLPGEIENRNYERALREGLEVSDELYQEITGTDF